MRAVSSITNEHAHLPDDRTPILEVRQVSLRFGGVTALSDVSFDVKSGEIRALIGPNGAGKTSMLNCISGFYKPTSGTIFDNGRQRDRLRPYMAARQGIARTFQNVALFKGMSALENILTGCVVRARSGFLQQVLWLGAAAREAVEHRRTAEEIIDFLQIPHVRGTPVGGLPYGLQKRVELGRALALKPSVLLLDEPMAGMNVEEKEDMCRFILDTRQRFGTSIVLIEHDIGVVMDLSDRIVVLDYGRKIADNLPGVIAKDPVVIAAYLGMKG